MIQNVNVETDLDNPGLYHIKVGLLSNVESIRRREQLEISSAASDDLVAKFWWWLYQGLAIRFSMRERAGTQDPGRTVNILRGYNGSVVLGTERNYSRNIFVGDGKESQFGDPTIGSEKSSHTYEELEVIWKLVWGYNDDANGGRWVSGLISEDIFLAAFLEVLFNGDLGLGGVHNLNQFGGVDLNGIPAGHPLRNLNRLISSLAKVSRTRGED